MPSTNNPDRVKIDFNDEGLLQNMLIAFREEDPLATTGNMILTHDEKDPNLINICCFRPASGANDARWQAVIVWRRPPYREPGIRDQVINCLPGILHWLADHAPWPTPTLRFVASTSNNILSCPFIITTSWDFYGRPLDEVFPRLNKDHKVESLADGLGEVFAGLLAPSALGTRAGKFSYSKYANPRWQLHPIHYVRGNVPETQQVLYYTKTNFEIFGPDAVYHWFKQCFALQKAEMEMAHARDKVDVRPGLNALSRLQELADFCSSQGWFRDCKFGYVDQAMCKKGTYAVEDHPTQDDPNEVRITCVRAKETAVLAPVFIGCRPPTWLWGRLLNEDRFTEEFDKKVNDMQWQKRIRTRFYTAAGPAFQKYATSPNYILARRLGWIALEGFKGPNATYILSCTQKLVNDFLKLRDHMLLFPTGTPAEQRMMFYGDDEPFVELDSDESRSGSSSVDGDVGADEAMQNIEHITDNDYGVLVRRL